MRFQVPQFIEVEDKIFGPFTFKQFVYLAGGAGMIAIVFSFLPKIIAFFLAIPIVALSVALTFYKVNNRPFVSILEAFFKYMSGKKLFIWKASARGSSTTGSDQATERRQITIPKLSESKLRDLTWNLSVKGNATPDEGGTEV